MARRDQGNPFSTLSVTNRSTNFGGLNESTSVSKGQAKVERQSLNDYADNLRSMGYLRRAELVQQAADKIGSQRGNSVTLSGDTIALITEADAYDKAPFAAIDDLRARGYLGENQDQVSNPNLFKNYGGYGSSAPSSIGRERLEQRKG